MNKVRDSILPGAFTMANLFFGFLSIIMVMQGKFLVAGWLIIIAAIMDGLDGKLARWLDKYSRFGAEFDSLADLISFGAAPAILGYYVYFQRFEFFGVVIVFFITLCGTLRLARFNSAEKPLEKNTYTGLPIPVSAITIASFIHFNYHLWGELKLDFLFTPLIAGLCFLMISHIKYDGVPRLTFRDTSRNRVNLIILTAGLALAVIWPATLFFPLCLIYIFHGLIRSVLKSLRKIAARQAEEVR